LLVLFLLTGISFVFSLLVSKGNRTMVDR